MNADLLIEGVSRECQVLSLRVREGVNGRSTLQASIQSEDGSYIPGQDDEVELIIDETEVRFAGVISEAEEVPWTPDGVLTKIVCKDYSALADRRLVKGTTDGGFTARDAVDYLIAEGLASYGVTRDPALGTGASIGALSYDWVTYTEAFNDIVRLAAPEGWLWRIDEDKVWTAWQPSLGDYPCPWALTSVTQIEGPLRILPSESAYANRVWLEYGDGTATPATVGKNDIDEQLVRGIWEKAFKAPGPISSDVADALAVSFLQTSIQRPRTIVFDTLEGGARAGQTLTVSLSEYGLAGDYLITDVATEDRNGAFLTYVVTAVPGSSIAANWKDTFREWSGKASGVASVGTVVITVPTPAASVFSLGGATDQAVVPGSGSWLPVVNAVPFVAPESRSVAVRVKLRARNAGITVTARLRNLTAGTTVNTSSGVTSTTATLTSFSGSVVAGSEYELQISASANSEGVYGIGSMEFA